ncbi:MAG: phosphohydrolase [Planctomycetota bacterium]
MSTAVHEIEVIQRSDRVEALFEPYRDVIGADLPGYRNHVYRTLTYAMHLLSRDEAARPVVETALVYHDIGLWTDAELAYLEPSEAKVREDAERHGWGLDIDLAVAAIHWHHKVTRYRGKGAPIVEAIRRADWIDATQGRVRKGLTRQQIAKVEADIPNEGFHDALQRLAVELGGSALRGNLRVLRRVFKW